MVRTVRNLLLVVLFLTAIVTQSGVQAIQPTPNSPCYNDYGDCGFWGGTWFSENSCNPGSYGYIWEVCDGGSIPFANACCNNAWGTGCTWSDYFETYNGCITGS